MPNSTGPCTDALSSVLAEVARKAAVLARAPIVALWIADKDGRSLKVGAVGGKSAGSLPLASLSFGQGGVGWVATERAPLEVDDVFADSRFVGRDWWRSHGLSSFFGLPVILEERLLGVLALNGAEPLRLSAQERDRLGVLIDQAAHALLGTQLEAEAARQRKELASSRAALRARLRESAGLLAIARIVGTTTDLTRALRLICRQLGVLTGADTVAAYLLDRAPGEVRPVAGYHVPKPLLEMLAAGAVRVEELKFSQALFDDQRAVWTDDAGADPRFANSLFARFPHRSAMAIPLVADAETSGGFYLVWWERRRQFEAEEVKTLEVIGEQVGMLLRNALDAQRNRAELAHVARISTMGELAAALAHELNQPLTAILSNAQAAQRFLAANPDDLGEVREILKDIVEDTKRTGELIHRLRALVRKEQPTFAPLDLGSIIRDVVLLVHSDAIRRNSRVSVKVDPGVPPVQGDRIQLQQVALNLLVNAFDAMRECPAHERHVVVRAELDGARMARVSVHDRGPGLSADKLDRIFEPFYSTKHEGLGMGLSISRAIIETHGGRLWAENNPDRGATFYFTVPVEEAKGTE